MSDNATTPRNDRVTSPESDGSGQLNGCSAAEAAGPRLVCLLVGMVLGGLLMGFWWMLAGLVFGGT